LVNVPVKLFKAQAPKDVRFHQLHQKDGVRIQQKRICPVEGTEVPYEEIVKGYEVSPDRYVIIEPDELGALDPKATHTIDIHDFVNLDDIDPLYFDNGYYVVPDTRAEKPYALLVAAMEQTRKVAIARFVMRTKEYLCAVRPKDGALVLATMLYADEIVPASELNIPTAGEDVSDREIKMATQLVESLSGAFEPEKYHDEYREKVMAMIEAKAEGNEVVSLPASQEPAPVVDLMAALEASLAAAKGKAAKGTSTVDADSETDVPKSAHG